MIVKHLSMGPLCRKVAPQGSSSPWLLCCKHTAASVGQNHFVLAFGHFPPLSHQWHCPSDSEGSTQPTRWGHCRGSAADLTNTCVHWKCAAGDATSDKIVIVWLDNTVTNKSMSQTWKWLLVLNFQLESSEPGEQRFLFTLFFFFFPGKRVTNGNNWVHWKQSEWFSFKCTMVLLSKA